MADGKVVIETGLDSSGIEKGLGKLGGLVKTGLSAAVGVIAGVSTALVGAGIASVKFGSDFEASIAKASTLFGDVNVNTDNLNSKILELSGSTGVAASEIGNSLYNALSAGIPATEDMGTAMTYMEQCTKLAKAGFTDVDTVVTSTAKVLNAYKMDVDQTDKVHKILMQTQNKGITTVGELGASLAQVTPTAAAMNVSFEQVGAALATMTAQGTPTAQATTQLNSLFAELGKQGTVASKSLEKATEGTKYAGKGFSDLMAEGVPLNEVLDLMGVSAGMSDQSLIDMFGSIEAGKAALAMSGKNAEQYTTNLKEMSTQTDVVGDAYEKVSDTFAEKSKKMVENAKNLGIAVYQGMEAPLKQMADSGIAAIEQLSSAFETGGLQGLVEEAGSIFADIAVKAAEEAPKMVDAAVGVIQSFVDGIIANKDRLYTAAVDIVKTLAGGVAELLPRSMGEPIKAAVDEIAKSFEDGGLKSAVESFTTLLTNVGKVAGNVGKVLLPPLTKALDLCGDNLDILVPLLVAGYTAFKGYTIVKTIASMMAGYRTILAGLIVLEQKNVITLLAGNGGLVAKQMIVGVLTGKITLATVAQAAWNAVMLANPVGLLVLGVAALGMAIGASSMFTDNNREATAKLNDEQKGLCETSKALYDSAKQLEESRQISIASSAQEIDTTSALWTELQANVDENGKVKAGYEARAEYITGQLSTALGIEMELQDGVIKGYKDQVDAINQLIQTKKAQVVLEAQESAYAEAVQKKSEALMTQLNLEQQATEKKAKLADAELRLTEASAKAKDELQRMGTTSSNTQKELDGSQATVDRLSKEYEKLSDGASNAKSSYEQYQTIIKQYEGLSSAIISGDSAKISAALLTIQTDFKRHGEAADEELKAQAVKASENMELLSKAIEDKVIEATDSSVAEFANMTALSLGELRKLPGGASEVAGQISPEVVGALASANMAGQLSQESQKALAGFIEGFSGLDAETKATFEKAIESAVEGCAGYEELKAKATEQGISFTEALRQSLESGEPEVAQASKDTTEAVSEGAAQADTTTVPVAKAEEATEAQKEALNAGGEGVAQESKATTEKINEGAESADTTTTATAVGTETVQALADSINGLKDIIVGAATSVADGVTEGLSASNVAPTCALIASQVSSGMVTALQGGAVVVNAAGAGLGNAIVEGVTSVGVGDAGVSSANAVALNMINAITNKYGVATMAGSGLANAISTGINSANIGNSGTMVANALTSNLISAINGKVSTATNAGTRLATAVGSGLKSANIQVTAVQIATMFVSSFLSPISGGSSKASSAARSMAGSAGSGLSGYGLGTTGYNTGSNYATSFASGISSSAYKSEVAAKAMATAAKDAANQALGIESPSKEGKRTGRFYGVGLEVGMENEEKNVRSASSKLANAALNGLDIGAIAEKMRNTVAMESAKMSAAITATVNFKVSGAVEAEKQNQSKMMDELAEKIADKLCTKGFGVKCNGREIGRLVGEFAR